MKNQSSCINDSHAFKISNQFFDFILVAHESSKQSQALPRLIQGISGALMHNICLPLMSNDMKEKLLKTQTLIETDKLTEDNSHVSQASCRLKKS